MTQKLSLNTQAILLLTAPLLLSKNSVSSDLLTNADYKMVVRHLLDLGKKPADFPLGFRRHSCPQALNSYAPMLGAVEDRVKPR